MSTAASPVCPIKPDDRQNQPQLVRVLHVINGEHYSGAERVQDLLASCLPEQGYAVDFACVKAGKFADSRHCQGARLHTLPMAGRFDLRVVRALVRLIRAEGFQLVHAHTPRTAMIARLAAAAVGVPMVYHVHSPTSRDSTRGVQNRINAWVERWSVKAAARLIAVSGSLGRHLREEGYAEEKIAVVPNGVPCVEEVPDRDRPEGEWVLGTVALFRPRKGTEVLIDAVAQLRKQGIAVRLRCVGGFETPWYEQQLKKRVAELGIEDAVEWTGFTKNVDGELARMDLFVLPSLFGEGLPMVVLEAMAAGVPVVATDVEGVPEAIRDGVDGLIVQPADADDLSQKIGRVIRGELDWHELRQSALIRQRKHFSDRSMAAGVAQVYADVFLRFLGK